MIKRIGLGYLMVLSACAPALAVPMSGLLAWYPYEGDAQDASGNGLHGSPWQLSYLPGHAGQAAWFNGDDSRMGMNVGFAPGDWTICGWAYVEVINSAWTDWQDFVSSSTQNFAVGIDNWDGGKLTLWVGGDTAQDPNPAPLQTPFFWLFEHDAGTCRIWRDGQLVASVASGYTPAFLRTVGQWIAGAASPMDREPMHGWLDEICIYNRVLDDAEKAELLGGGGTVEAVDLPRTIGLLEAWPNPFNPSTTLSFDLADPARVQVRLLDMQGREALLVYDGWLSRGAQRFNVEAGGMASGIYIAQVSANGQHQAMKLILLR
ncbi:MAG: LamG-like jellyroll fold domain-containing protein [bacterium]|jgi:hypothetical protein|nr:LamG-like jellyroll fold domain-containing protein [bacterium]